MFCLGVLVRVGHRLWRAILGEECGNKDGDGHADLDGVAEVEEDCVPFVEVEQLEGLRAVVDADLVPQPQHDHDYAGVQSLLHLVRQLGFGYNAP